MGERELRWGQSHKSYRLDIEGGSRERGKGNGEESGWGGGDEGAG